MEFRMTFNEIELPRKLTHQLLHLAQSDPDREVCGLIGADSDGHPISCYPIRNASETPQNRFLLDTSEHFATIRTMRNRGESLFAIFHSHPFAPATPSTLDIEQTRSLNALHLIISLNTKGILELRCFSIGEAAVSEIPLRLVES